MSDTYLTIAAPSTGEFKDRASKFLAFAWPVEREEDAIAWVEALRKEHFKANHHCFAWRFGRDGTRFRANDDGEPSGTAGRPILGQIDALGLTDVVVVVVRYFGGTLLGATGLIHAYRESAAEALRAATIREVVLEDQFEVTMTYAFMPDVVQALHKLQFSIKEEVFGNDATLKVAVRQRDSAEKMLQFKAQVLKISTDEAVIRDWPEGIVITPE